MKRKPAVVIEKARCGMCRNHGSVHEIVTGRILGKDHSGLRLTNGCKTTFGSHWSRVTDPKERRPWVKKYWEENT